VENRYADSDVLDAEELLETTAGEKLALLVKR